MEEGESVKNKTEKTSIRVSIELCVVGLIVIGIVLGACLLVDRYKTKRAPQHDTCAKCQHLFAKGSGKAVTVVTVQDADPLAPEAGKPRLFCSEHAPRYDRVFETMNGETVFAYYVKNEPFSMSDSNGDRLDKPKPCGREHVPQADAIVWTNVPNEWRWINSTNSPR